MNKEEKALTRLGTYLAQCALPVVDKELLLFEFTHSDIEAAEGDGYLIRDPEAYDDIVGAPVSHRISFTALRNAGYMGANRR